MKQGQKVRVVSTAPHHANREGIFQFFGEGPSEGVAVVKDPLQSSGSMECLFAVKKENLIPA